MTLDLNQSVLLERPQARPELDAVGLEPHPLALAIPPMSEEEFAALRDDIAKRGCIEAIVTFERRILDGIHRERACRELGIKAPVAEYMGGDALGFVVAKNLHRRHLNPGQIGLVTLDLLPHYEAEAQAREKAGTQAPQGARGKAVEYAARITGAAPRTVERAKRVSQKAPELAKRVMAGDLDLKDAERQLTRRIAQERETEARKTTFDATVADAEGPGWKMLHGDFRDRLADLEPGSVDAVITDPPYNADSLWVWSHLGKHAGRLLKPQGLLIACSGLFYLLEVGQRLREHLDYGWTYCQPMPGQNSRFPGRHVFQTWKPWLVFSNGAWPSGLIDWHEDTTDPSKMAKSYRWQQGGDPAGYLLERLTHPGAVVLDPMTGTGTYGEVAVALGREFIGVEADGARFEQGTKRIGAAGALVVADLEKRRVVQLHSSDGRA